MSPLDYSNVTVEVPHNDAILESAPCDITVEAPQDDIIDVTTCAPLDTAMVMASPYTKPRHQKRRRNDEMQSSVESSMVRKIMKTKVTSRAAHKVNVFLFQNTVDSENRFW